MAGLPSFPIGGTILSRSVHADRISFAVNSVGSSIFPQGEYVFFTKNGSIWYRFRAKGGAWTNDTLYIAGAKQSNTKFDDAGYPVTGYLNAQGELCVDFYNNAFKHTYNFGFVGALPTVVPANGDITVFWVPTDYTDSLQFSQLCKSFLNPRSYKVGIPGSIANMQIESLRDSSLFFTFESDYGVSASKKVYVAFTNPAKPFVTADLKAFVTFVEGIMYNEYIVVAEFLQKEQFTNVALQLDGYLGDFAIEDLVPLYTTTDITGTHQHSDEHFAYAQLKHSHEVLTALIDAFGGPEIFDVRDLENSQYDLVNLPFNKSDNDETWVIQELDIKDGLTQKLTQALMSPIYEYEEFKLLEGENTAVVSGDAWSVSGSGQDLLFIIDDNTLRAPVYTTTPIVITPPGSTTESFNTFEYIGISEVATASGGNFVFSVDTTVGLSLDFPEISEYFVFDDRYAVQSELTQTVFLPIFEHWVESFSISDTIAASATLTDVSIHGEWGSATEYFYVEDPLPASGTLTAIEQSGHLHDTLQFGEFLDIVTSGVANTSNHFVEPAFLIGIANVISNVTLIDLSARLKRDSFTVFEAGSTTNLTPSIYVRLPQDALPYNYVGYTLSEGERRMLTVTADADVAPLYFYYSGAKTPVTRMGPQTLSVSVSDTAVDYFLHPL